MNKTLLILAGAAAVMPISAKNLKADVDLSHSLWWEAPEVPTINIALTDTLGAANTSALRFRVTSDRDESQAILDVAQP